MGEKLGKCEIVGAYDGATEMVGEYDGAAEILGANVGEAERLGEDDGTAVTSGHHMIRSASPSNGSAISSSVPPAPK